MTETTDERMAAALREVIRLYRAAAVEVLMREYRWRAGAAERFADLMVAEAAEGARRAAELRRTMQERTMHEHG